MVDEKNSEPDILKHHFISCYGMEMRLPDRGFIELLTGGSEPQTQAEKRYWALLEKKEAGIKLKHGIYVVLLMILSIALIVLGAGFVIFLVPESFIAMLMGVLSAQLILASYLFWTDLFDL
jgi:hypothetical protein